MQFVQSPRVSLAQYCNWKNWRMAEINNYFFHFFYNNSEVLLNHFMPLYSLCAPLSTSEN